MVSAMDVSDAIGLDEAVQTAVRALDGAVNAFAKGRGHVINTLVVAWVCSGDEDDATSCIICGDRAPEALEFVAAALQSEGDEIDLPAMARRLS